MREVEPDAAAAISECSRLILADRIEDAQAVISRAARDHPAEPRVQLEMAIAFMQGDRARSAACARRAAQLAPDEDEMQLQAASVLFQIDDLAGAAEHLERARRLMDEGSPLFADLLHLAGRVAAELGEDEQAERALRAAFELSPEVLAHGQLLAWFLVERGRNDEARAVGQAALVHHPDDEWLREL